MRVLTIGHDKELLRHDSAPSVRYRAYGTEVTELHAVVFARAPQSRAPVTLADNVVVHPTGSKSTLGLLVDAYRIGRALLSEKGAWYIVAQDPFEAGLVAWLLSRATGVPFQVQEHGDFFSTPHWRRESLMNHVRYLVGRYIVRRAAHVRVVSERIKKTFERLGVAPDRITVGSVYTDTDTFAHAQPDPDIQALRPEGGVLMLTMARLVPQKNLFLLIRSFADVCERGIPARLVIVGRGPERAALEVLAESLVPERVVFRDWTDHPECALKAADLYALSSNYEGWARVAVEALAAGTPLVMTDVGCAGQVVQDGVNGLVVPVGDRQALTKALVRLAGDTMLRAELVRQGKLTVEKLPSIAESAHTFVSSLRA